MLEKPKRVIVKTNTSQNLIQLARTDPDAYRIYKDLLKNDYILYLHSDGESKLYKRTFIHELWKRKDLISEGNLYYTLDEPQNTKLNKQNYQPKLLVIFTCMPDSESYDSSLTTDRMFPKFFNGIERSLIKNVYIMRIMDLNCSHGSHYINTVNNSWMEEEVVSAITSVKEKLNITLDDITLYGASKGGSGSLYFGAKMDCKCLSVDPIISLEEYNEKDTHFLKDLRVVDISTAINDNLQQHSQRKKFLIGSENVKFNFSKISTIVGENLTIINEKDEHIITHADVSRNTVPIQLMLLNYLLQHN
ncbi:MAG: XcbB/CpsF family capsular polysaccharide biosynthesis protein [Vagococcus salmoninarum]